MGIEYFIDPSLRGRFGPVLKGLSDFIRTPDPKASYRQLMTSGANIPRATALGHYLSDLTGFALDATAGRLFPGLGKGVSKLSRVGSSQGKKIDDFLTSSAQTKKNIKKGKSVNKLLSEMDPKIYENMTAKDLQKYLKDNFDIIVSDRKMYKKVQKLNLPVMRKMDFQLKSKLQKAFDEIGNVEDLTKDELWAMPQIQKIAEEGFLTPTALKNLRNKMGYGSKRVPSDYFSKFGLNHDEVIKHITSNNPTTPELIKKFPKLQKAVDEGKIKHASINLWRNRNKLSHVPSEDLKSIQQLKKAEHKKLRIELHLPSSKDIQNVSPVIKDAIEKELSKGRIESYHPAMVKHRGDVSGIGSDRITLQNYLTKGRKEAAYDIGPDLRNKLHVRFENWIPTVTAKKNRLISQFKNNKIAKDDFLESLEKINNDLNLAKADMEKLGLMSKLFNPRTKKVEYFGKPYNNTLELIKDIRNEYNLFSKVGKKYGTLGGKEKIPGLKAKTYNEGGMVGMDYLTRPI